MCGWYSVLCAMCVGGTGCCVCVWYWLFYGRCLGGIVCCVCGTGYCVAGVCVVLSAVWLVCACGTLCCVVGVLCWGGATGTVLLIYVWHWMLCGWCVGGTGCYRY